MLNIYHFPKIKKQNLKPRASYIKVNEIGTAVGVIIIMGPWLPWQTSCTKRPRPWSSFITWTSLAIFLFTCDHLLHGSCHYHLYLLKIDDIAIIKWFLKNKEKSLHSKEIKAWAYKHDKGQILPNAKSKKESLADNVQPSVVESEENMHNETQQ